MRVSFALGMRAQPQQYHRRRRARRHRPRLPQFISLGGSRRGEGAHGGLIYESSLMLISTSYRWRGMLGGTGIAIGSGATDLSPVRWWLPPVFMSGACVSRRSMLLWVWCATARAALSPRTPSGLLCRDHRLGRLGNLGRLGSGLDQCGRMINEKKAVSLFAT